MNLIVVILLIAGLALLTYQDLRFREVHWALFALIFICCSVLTIQSIGLVDTATNFGLNIGILAVQLGLMTLYFLLKGIQPSTLFRDYLGLGDVLILIVFAVLCSPFNYIIFFIGSALFSMISFFVFNVFAAHKAKTIPLAGLQSLALVFVLLSGYNLSNESQFISWITTI